MEENIQGDIVQKEPIESEKCLTASDYNSQRRLLDSDVIITSKSSKESKSPAARETWGKSIDFFLSVAGGFIGLGNVWRFPYLCYRNGGGAFLIPYFIFLVIAGIPIFFLEVGIGQFTSEGGITAWERLAPITSGIGHGSIALTIILNMYYVVVLAWAIYYMYYSFQSELPWTKCGEWATNCCRVEDKNLTGSCVRDPSKFPTDTNITWNLNWTSPTQEFWENKVLKVSNSVEERGDLDWGMVLCLAISWFICYLCVCKGVKQTGKMLIVLLFRGITLPGAWDGVFYYLNPDLNRLKDAKVWVDAGTQIFFSYALCKGQLTSLGSYNKFNKDIYKDVWILSAFNSGTSFVSGFAIFAILGFMAQERGLPIAEVAESGPGLAFIAYPRAVALMPWPQFWAVCFFFMVLLLGLDSCFVGMEAIITATTDIYPSYRKGRKRQLLLVGIVLVSFCIGLTMCFQNGIYVFTLFDYYGASGICLLWLCLSQCIAIGWIYGGERFWQNCSKERMIGYRPFPLFKWCWKFFSPVLIIGLLYMLLANFKPLTYRNTRQDYSYPLWFESIGFCLAACSVLPVIIYALMRFCLVVLRGPGSFKENLSLLTKSNLKDDHPFKSSENDAPVDIPFWNYWLGDWLGNKIKSRFDMQRIPAVDEPEVIRYGKSNSEC